MQKKRILTAVCSLALILVVGAGTALATPSVERAESAGVGGGAGWFSFKTRPDTESPPEELLLEMDEEMAARHAEMEAQMKERMAEQQAQWDALTEAGKAELLGLQQKLLQTEQQLVERYYELGLIDLEQAEQMHTMLAEQLQALADGGPPSLALPRLGGGSGEAGGGRFRMDDARQPENLDI